MLKILKIFYLDFVYRMYIDSPKPLYAWALDYVAYDNDS